MRIQLLSDLHLEVNTDFVAQPAPGADLLVLAGDIGSYQKRSRLPELGDTRFGLARFSPKPEFAAWPTPVAYLPGNHEYDGLDYAQTHTRLRTLCDELGLIWLDQQSTVIDGIRFVGDTLWSDFESIAVHEAGRGVAHQWQERDKAFVAANHYLSKYSGFQNGERMLAAQIRDLALARQAWLHDTLQQPFHGKTVVVTHFAPSLRSADPRYGLQPGTAGFCNALDGWFDLADLWLHGHVHCRHDYRAGRCRVVANPLGYASSGEQDGFLPQAIIEI